MKCFSPPTLSLSRDDLHAVLTGLLDALAPYTSPGDASIHFGNTATHYGETAAHHEGLSRSILGLAEG